MGPKDLAKRQFEMKARKNLKINGRELTRQERNHALAKELKKRQSKKVCPACFKEHNEPPPDSCFEKVFKSGWKEMTKIFDLYLRRNGFGRIEG